MSEQRLDEILAEIDREISKLKEERDAYNNSAAVLADKRDRLRKKARALISEASVCKQRRDEEASVAGECRAKRNEWNDKVRMMKASGGLGDIGEAKSQADSWHRKALRASQECELAHEKIRQLYEEADRLRAEADTAHEQCVDCRKAADLAHEKYIAAIKKKDRIRNNLPD